MSTTLVQPPDPERGRARLQREQLRLLFALLPVALMFSAMVATVVAVSLWRAGSTAGLVPWAAAFVVVAGARLGLLVAYRRLSEAPEDPLPWLRFSLVGAFLSGCVWGGAIVFLMPGGTPLNETLLVIAVAGIAAGAVTTLAPVWLLTVAFVVPAVLPVVIVFAAQGRYGIAATAALFLAGLLVVGRRQAAIFGESVRLRLDLADSEAALRDREARYRLIFQSAPLGIFSFDRDTTITDCNEEFADILGASREQLLGLNMARDLRDAQVKTAVQRCLQYGSGEYEGDYEPVVGSRTTPVRALFRALRGEDGAAVGGVAVVEDFSERRRAAAIIEHQANYDPLTDLPNRRLLLARIDEVLAARQADGGSAGLVFLDLDHFKRINDSLGHAVGDRLLRAVATRLAGTLRAPDMAARLSGDEFVALVQQLGDGGTSPMTELEELATRIIDRLGAPYEMGGHELHITPSLGLVMFPDGQGTASEILTQADTAMYRAKAAGRSTSRLFRASMQAELEERVALEADLREALDRGDVQANYQVVVNRQRAVVGAEALARWQHSQRGRVSPGEFIPVAEDSGLIVALGAQMLRQACEQIAGPERRLPRVSVNVSPRQFREPGFAERVERILDETGAEPSRLILEVTENLLVENLELAAGTMHRLKARGVRLSIDDFGMGYSSLAYLKRLPLDVLKIDQHFIRDVNDNANDLAIVETILAMAEHLNLTVIAEGVETEQQFQLLRARGCRFFQGFLFGHAVPVAAGLARNRAAGGG